MEYILWVFDFLCIALLFLIFIVNWFRSLRQLKNHWKIGLFVGCVAVSLKVLVIVFHPNTELLHSFITILLSCIVSFCIALCFTMLGMYYSNCIGIRNHACISITIIEIFQTILSNPTRQSSPLDRKNETESIQSQKDNPVIKIIYIGTIVGSLCSFYSMILYFIFKPDCFNSICTNYGPLGQLITIAFVISWAILKALEEEVIFRLGIQNYFGKIFSQYSISYWYAILLTSFIWTIGHISMVMPVWINIAQMFPIGVLLGWLYWRFGIESCIIARFILNILLIPISQYLIQ
jgi:hypothetical protein